MKLNRYNGFILESTFYDLLLESKLKYMTEFTQILTDIKSDSSQESDVREIATFLLKISNKEMKLTQNFIGIDQADKVSFVPDNKVIRDSESVSIKVDSDGSLKVVNHEIIDLLKIPREGLHFTRMESELPSNSWKILNTYNGREAGDSYEQFTLHHLQNITDPTYHVITYDDSNAKSFGNVEHYELPENLRGSIKIGRFVNRILDIWFKENNDITSDNRTDYTPAMIEKFVNAYTAKVLFNQNIFDYFEVVEGEDIRKWYHVDNYALKQGQLGSSCMRYSNTQSYLNIYVENPETCQLLIFKNETKDKINGRALLWTSVDGKKYMDRIYTSKDNFKNLFQSWATKNDYGDVYGGNDRVKVKVINKNYVEYPYMDSLCYFKFTDNDESFENGPGKQEDEAFLYSDNNNPDRPFYYIQSTSGGYSERS